MSFTCEAAKSLVTLLIQTTNSTHLIHLDMREGKIFMSVNMDNDVLLVFCYKDNKPIPNGMFSKGLIKLKDLKTLNIHDTVLLLISNQAITECVGHIQTVLNKRKVEEFYITDNITCSESIFVALNSIKFARICVRPGNNSSFRLFYRDALRKLRFQTDWIEMCCDSSVEFREVLIQNLCLFSAELPFKIKLNELLAIQSSEIFIEWPISSADLNIFLKHWICGFNKRVKCCWIQLENIEVMNEQELLTTLLKNIKHTRSPQNRVINFSLHSFPEILVQGGIDIQNEDGRTATIYFDIPNVFKMCVWNCSL